MTTWLIDHGPLSDQILRDIMSEGGGGVKFSNGEDPGQSLVLSDCPCPTKCQRLPGTKCLKIQRDDQHTQTKSTARLSSI